MKFPKIMYCAGKGKIVAAEVVRETDHCVFLQGSSSTQFFRAPKVSEAFCWGHTREDAKARLVAESRKRLERAQGVVVESRERLERAQSALVESRSRLERAQSALIAALKRREAAESALALAEELEAGDEQ